MSKVKFEPALGRVLIKQDEAAGEKVTAAGIIHNVGGGKEKPLTGIVVAMNPVDTWPQIGDRVQWQRYREVDTKVEGVVYAGVPIEELHGKFL